jgi:hypothetical protein
MRFSAVQFGGKTSNGLLSLFMDGVVPILRTHASEIGGGGFILKLTDAKWVKRLAVLWLVMTWDKAMPS